MCTVVEQTQILITKPERPWSRHVALCFTPSMRLYISKGKLRNCITLAESPSVSPTTIIIILFGLQINLLSRRLLSHGRFLRWDA